MQRIRPGQSASVVAGYATPAGVSPLGRNSPIDETSEACQHAFTISQDVSTPMSCIERASSKCTCRHKQTIGSAPMRAVAVHLEPTGAPITSASTKHPHNLREISTRRAYRSGGGQCQRSTCMIKMISIVRAMAAILPICGISTAVASAAAYSAVNLNVRAGPGSRFPAVGMLGAGIPITVHGCLVRYIWCDVTASGLRGWVSGAYIEIVSDARRVQLPAYSHGENFPVVTFHIDSYWEDHYRDYPFSNEMDHWRDEWDGDRVPILQDDWSDWSGSGED